MKKKEILKRLSAVCMSAVMSVSLLSSSVYASEELFVDGRVSTEAELTDEQYRVAESTDTEDTDDSADLDVIEGDADEKDAVSDVEITEEDAENGVD